MSLFYGFCIEQTAIDFLKEVAKATDAVMEAPAAGEDNMLEVMQLVCQHVYGEQSRQQCVIAARAANSPTLTIGAALSHYSHKQENPVGVLLAADDALGPQDTSGDSEQDDAPGDAAPDAPGDDAPGDAAEPTRNPDESFCEKLTKEFSAKVTLPQQAAMELQGEDIILPLKDEIKKEWRGLCKVCWRPTRVPKRCRALWHRPADLPVSLVLPLFHPWVMDL